MSHHHPTVSFLGPFLPFPHRTLCALIVVAWSGLSQAQQATADGSPVTTPKVAGQLNEVVIKGHYDNAVGTSDAASQGVIGAELLKNRPALRPGEVLEFVPGMVVTQHSGDGKANQYFLRGFNLDHGTDFATSVNGMPVNMASHAHGQGYSDLNFLMPELVQRIEYRKGPYFATHGDFSAAGAADIVYYKQLDAPFVSLELGQNGYKRALVAGSKEISPGITLLGAFEGMGNNGPWTVPEKLKKTNVLVTLSGGNVTQGWSASAMHYSARWDATDQVPERLIEAGSYNGQPFGRFDSLDASDGGSTKRSSLSAEWHGKNGQFTDKVSAYALKSQLNLFSNFTYALDRPDTGDQFSQQEQRTVYGAAASRSWGHKLGEQVSAQSTVGLQLRQDRVNLGLFDSNQRVITDTVRDDHVQQTLASVYGETAVEWMPWLRTTTGLRFDQLSAQVDSRTLPENSGSSRSSQLSPKLSVVLGPWAQTEFFVNAGRGFHSNDVRGTTITVDPRTGDLTQKVPGLVSARGFELGARTEWLPGLQSSVALWRLNFDSELVYIGDAGNTEPGLPSRRSGLEWNNHWTPAPWFLLDADLALSRARFADGSRITNAVDRVVTLAATVSKVQGWTATLQWRYIGSGALTNDNSVRMRPSINTSLRLRRDLTKNVELSLDVFNLFNRKNDDIQYYYESQLPGQATPVADRHVHPAEPRTVRVSLRVNF